MNDLEGGENLDFSTLLVNLSDGEDIWLTVDRSEGGWCLECGLCSRKPGFANADAGYVSFVGTVGIEVARVDLDF